MSTRDDPEFNKVTGRFEYEDDEGQTFEQDPTTKAWFPVLSPEQIEAQQKAYAVAGVSEEAVPAKKRKKEEADQEGSSGKKAKRKGNLEEGKDGEQEPARKPKETAVYVQGLPPAVTVQELADTFSKCGLLGEDPLTSQPRIKIYTHPDGSQKGDALVTYFREESVSLAITMLDDIDLRGDGKSRLRVSKATFEPRPAQSADKADQKPARHDNEVPESVLREKKKKRAGKLRAKLNDWSSSEDDREKLLPKRAPEASNNKHAKVVVLKHMFTLAELDKDPGLLLEIKADVREECETMGQVTNVVLYDADPEGVMLVRFKDPLAALQCVSKMHGRFFGGNKVEAALHDGKTKYRRSERGGGDDDDEEAERLAKFGSWLEGAEDEED